MVVSEPNCFFTSRLLALHTSSEFIAILTQHARHLDHISVWCKYVLKSQSRQHDVLTKASRSLETNIGTDPFALRNDPVTKLCFAAVALLRP